MYAFDSEMPDLTKIFLKGSSRSWNDAVSAVKVGKNAKLVLFEHINYESPLGEIQGEGQTVKAVELHSVGWGDKVSVRKKQEEPAEQVRQAGPGEQGIPEGPIRPGNPEELTVRDRRTIRKSYPWMKR